MRDDLRCAICREVVAMDQRHVEIEAATVAEDAPEEEYYVLHLSCWDSVGSGWGRP